MNRVGMVIDMRHSGEGSTMSALEHSSRPITVTHANPATWHPAQRTKSDPVIGALAGTGAVLGLSLCPHHLNGGSICQVKDFYTMIARTADWFGRQFPVIGADLVQDQPDTVVEWMRTGRWAQSVDDGEGSKAPPRLSGHARLIPRKDRTQGGHLDRGWSRRHCQPGLGRATARICTTLGLGVPKCSNTKVTGTLQGRKPSVGRRTYQSQRRPNKPLLLTKRRSGEIPAR